MHAAMDITCDKGPILEQLLTSVGRLEGDSKRMVDALVDIAKHQERIIALADRTTENREDIDTLYRLHRESDAHLINAVRDLDSRIVSHLINHPNPESCKAHPLLRPSPDGKFDKIQVAVILALVYFLSNQAWSLISSLVTAAQNAAGGQ